jgi:xylulose-5-phosphate/fructose-6-phosphate phosphoketolase
MAAAAWLRENAPDLRVRVVNVVDLMALRPRDKHPHRMSDERFSALFTENAPVIFAFHGYPGAIRQLVHGRSNPGRFHVRGYVEEGTTTTPFDMVVLTGMSRFHLAMGALNHCSRRPRQTTGLLAACEEALTHHRQYIREHLEDMPEIRDWTWPGL